MLDIKKLFVKLVQRSLKSADQNVGNITLSAGGYYSLSLNIPAAAYPVAIMPLNWNNATGAWTLMPYAGTQQGYVIGTPGTSIQNLQIRTWYVL